MKKLPVLSLVSAVLFVPTVIDAQTVPFVNLGYNSEQMAMGGTNATYNSAAAFSDESRAEFSFFKWQPEATNSSMFGLNAAVKAGDRLAILLDGKYNALPEIPGYDGSGNPSGTIKSNQMYAALGASYAVTDKIGLALKAKYISDKLTDAAKAGAICADFSINCHTAGFDIALLASNIGSKLNYGSSAYSLPMLVKAGAAKEFNANENITFKLAADAGYIINAESFTAGIGAELGFAEIFDIRAGYHIGTNMEPSFASFGIGVNISVVRFSAFYLLGPADAGNTLGASLGIAF